MTFEQIEEAFTLVWKSIQDFVPMDSKLESERIKRPGILLQQESSKRMKTVKASEPSQEQQTRDPKELSDKELKDMMELVPVEEVYFEALQVKRPIIAWDVYTECQIKLWKITRVRDYTELYQKFEDMMKRFAEKTWTIYGVWFKRIIILNSPMIKRHMHDPLKWKLYDTCGVHRVFTGRGQEIFMLVEKDYPITKGLATLMLCNKLQVDQYSEMANALIVSHGEFPLPEELSTADKDEDYIEVKDACRYI
ncbi:hypothetical protein Tco_0565966 [Tanacetum coccineum]